MLLARILPYELTQNFWHKPQKLLLNTVESEV